MPQVLPGLRFCLFRSLQYSGTYPQAVNAIQRSRLCVMATRRSMLRTFFFPRTHAWVRL